MPSPIPDRLLLLGRSVRHTDLRRLLHRLRLTGKRWVAERLPPASFHPVRQDRTQGSLPAPLFPPRAERGGHGAHGSEARFLGKTWPLGDPVEWQPKAGQLERMNLHYMEFLEGLDSPEMRRLISDWIRNNPPHKRGYWRDSWNSYALSIRCVVWMQEAARRRLDLQDAWGTELRRSLRQQLDFLMGNLELDIRGNHLLKNIKALLWGAAFFHDAGAWRRKGEDLLREELEDQILPDGLHFERSPAYHLQAFADLLECWPLLEEASLRRQLGETLGRMAQAAVDLRHPDGLPSLFNDAGLHMAYPPEACLDAFERLIGRAPEPRPVFAFPDAGYFGLRGPGSLLIVDCGAIAPDALPAHGHGDILGFEWSIGGQRLVIDTGVFEYIEGPRRSRSRATAAHNTVTLDGLDQCEFWGSFRVGRRARVRLHRFAPGDEAFELAGSHDGYAHLPGRPVHHRAIVAAPRSIRVTDRIDGGSGQIAEARLLLHPDARAAACAEGLRIDLGGVHVLLRASHPMAIEPAPWYPDFGIALETTQVVLRYGPAPCEGSFTLEQV